MVTSASPISERDATRTFDGNSPNAWKRRMQSQLATAIKTDPEWKEFEGESPSEVLRGKT